MAEIAGLVLGTLALVGVFEDCIGLISQITAAKSMGQDYEKLDTKLDIEKTLLLQWANRIHLFHRQQYDTRLDDPETRRVIERTLGCIRLLLSESNELQRRYGVRPAQKDEETETSSTVSSRLMSHFRQESQSLKLWRESQLLKLDQEAHAFQLRIDDHKKDNSTFTKIKWVIKDREKFEGLIRDLSDLIAGLNKVIPDKQDSTRTSLKREIGRMRNVPTLKLILHASTDDNNDLVDVTKDAITRSCAQSILERLWFRLIDDRKDNISEAHSETLEWAIHPPTSAVAWSDLSKWLRLDHDIYWVSGKPGSGKSTLMKFLFHHRHVKRMLDEWAGDRTLTMASFFLWNLGSAEQKSQQGLARGLLYHVLNANQSLIPIILPNMWREAKSGNVELNLPSNNEMSQAFSRLGTEATDGAYVFFIDGLDEYSGDYRDGISFVKKLAKSFNIKILLSSRPIDSCVAAFSSKPMLALQDLTKGDIELYVTHTVRSHPYVAKLRTIDGTITEQFLEDLQRKAAGVFLWVVLACRSLLEGFAAYDNPTELQDRVNELPPELGDLFRHILDKISPRYRTQAAKLLQICYRSRLLEISDCISALALAWVDEQKMEIPASKDFRRCSSEESRAKCEMLEGRLLSRCMGLLEVHHRATTLHSKSYDGLVESSVDFMHRTVFEFLNTPGVWEMDCLQVHDDKFDATAILSYMASHLLYLQEEPIWESDDACNLARQSLEYVQRLDESGLCHVSSALHLLAVAFLKTRKASPRRYTPDSGPTKAISFVISKTEHRNQELEFFFGPDQVHFPPDHAILLLAVETNLINFIRNYDLLNYLNSQAQIVYYKSQRYPLLYHAIMQPLLSQLPTFKKVLSKDMIDILLRSGCDVNEKFFTPGNEITTPWKTWKDSLFFTPKSDLEAAEITITMLQAGVNLNPSNPGGLPVPARSGDLPNGLVAIAGRWLIASENTSERLNQDRLREFCNEIIRLVDGALPKKQSNGQTGQIPLAIRHVSRDSEHSKPGYRKLRPPVKLKRLRMAR